MNFIGNGGAVKIIVFASLIALSITAQAQQIVSTSDTYDERLRGGAISSLGTDLFGDLVSNKDGVAHFSQTDVSIQTNSGLPLEFTRHTPRKTQGLDKASMPIGPGWEIDVPYMMGTYDTRHGWNANGSVARCSTTPWRPYEMFGPLPDFNMQRMTADMYWSGIHINIPHVGYESLLTLPSGQARPQDGTHYVGGARGFWRVGCLPGIKNGTGEGFFVKVPNGNKYYFDWMATRNAFDVVVSELWRGSNGEGYDSTKLLVPTSDVFLYATRVEDRYGNYINYNYDSVNKHRLMSIESSDGSRIDLSYDEAGQVSEVRAGGRIWKYFYADSIYGRKLSEIILPDQSRWTFSGDVMWWFVEPPRLPEGFYKNGCAEVSTGYLIQDPPPQFAFSHVVMTHPSGAQGSFTFRSLIHGSDDTPGTCSMQGTFYGNHMNYWYGTWGVPNAYLAKSLVSKKISGPGLSELAWSYTYFPSWSFAKDCSQGCYSRTQILNPDATLVEYVFGNSYSEDYGFQYSEKIIKAGSVYRFVSQYQSASGPYPESYGDIPGPSMENPLSTKIKPVSLVETRQQGRIFRMQVNSFDSFGRAVTITRSSSVESP